MTAPRRLWPDTRQTLLLHAALAPAPKAAHAWRQLTGAIAPGAVEAWLDALDPGSRRLLPLVRSQLLRHGAERAKIAALDACAKSAHEAQRRFTLDVEDVLRALSGAGVPTIVLKGGALVDVYEEPGERPVSDLDVLVPLSRATEAAGVLRAVGFRPRSPLTRAALRFTHSCAWDRTSTIPVDLHWHVYEECCRPDHDDDLWAAAVPAAIGGAPTCVLAIEDQLVHACVHGEKWVFVPGIRWIADAVTILRRRSVNWDRLLSQAIARRFVLRLREQLAYLVTEFDAPVPSPVLAALAAAPSTSLERFEDRFSVRDRRRPWALVYWCNHLRATNGAGWTAALTFAQYLQAIWRLETVAEVPRAGLTKVFGRLW
jgi:hypothetical protein